MDSLRNQLSVVGAAWIITLIPIFGTVVLYRVLSQDIYTMRLINGFKAAVAASLARHSIAAATVDLSWHAPNATRINDLSQVFGGSGIHGFIFNSSSTPTGQYGTYNWCNMPHVRAKEYIKPSSDYKLQYIEVVSRHTFCDTGQC